ncbi:proline--tRNA ligase [soil metagenome]
MRMSKLFVTTLRDAPAGTDTVSAQLLTRAGFQRQLGAGIYSLLPFGDRTARRIEQILREEMEAIDCYELTMPFVQPSDLWKETGRWEKVGPEMVRLRDRSERDMVLAPTHEEVATDLVRRAVRSYRELPFSFFQIQTKFRDEPRPRGGLLRCREFVMKDAYSFSRDDDDFRRVYNQFYKAYLRIFARLDLPVIVVEASGGYMASEISHQFTYESEIGEDTLLISPNGNYAVNAEVATTRLEIPEEDLLDMEEVSTPDCKTIEDVAKYLDVPTSRTLKAMFYDVGGELIFVVIRGDREVSEEKLSELLNVDVLAFANADLIRSAGAVPGYASPVGLEGVRIIADESARSPNLVAGANKVDFHTRNVNLGRDYQAETVADIAQVRGGMPSPIDGAPLIESRGIEIGNIFSLGTTYSKPLGATYLDDEDREHTMIMGSYGIGVGRNMATIAEHHHDDNGLRWPISVAPFDIHIVTLGNDTEIQSQAESLYREFMAAGIDTLFDDRPASPGVKFADADLIGVPIRVTVSSRSIQAGGAEIKRRDQDREAAVVIPLDETVAYVEAERSALLDALLESARDAEGLAPA